MSKLFEPLRRNVPFREVVKPRWVLEPPNYTRTPLWRQFLEVQFSSRNFFVFGSTWAALASFGFVLWYSRLLGLLQLSSPADPPPLERLDRYWLNSRRSPQTRFSAKFRILSAYYNKGKRPGAKISLMTYEVRYFDRGLDHPFTMNEVKDFLFKVKENYLIENHPGVQYPSVFRQHSNVKTPATLHVNLH